MAEVASIQMAGAVKVDRGKDLMRSRLDPQLLPPLPQGHSIGQNSRPIHQFLEAHNEAPKPFVWTKTADQILATIARFAQRTIAIDQTDF